MSSLLVNRHKRERGLDDKRTEMKRSGIEVRMEGQVQYELWID